MPTIERNVWLTIPDPFCALTLARAGFDSVTIDLQHGLFDEAAAIRTLMTLGDLRPRRWVRIGANDPAAVGRMLDAGADGLIVPMVDSAAEARALAEAALYPPLGRRSFGPVLANLRPAGNGPPRILAMIETRAAFEAVDAILAVDGIDGVYVGPNDLGLGLGFGPGSDRTEPEMLAALARIAGAARDAGKQAGLFCLSARYAASRVADGFDLLTIAVDAAMLRQAAAGAIEAFRDEQGALPLEPHQRPSL